MKIDDLKPAWQLFKWQNSLEELDTTHILSIIERPEEVLSVSPYGWQIHTFLFLLLFIGCQGS